MHEKSAKVYHRHPVCNKLEKKASECKILLHSNTEHQRTQQCHNKSFIIKRLFNPRESFDCGLPSMRWNKDGKRKLFFINQKISNTEE